MKKCASMKARLAQATQRAGEAAKLAEEAAAAEKEASAQQEAVEEAEVHVENMPDGPKKMLKVRALKAAKLAAQRKAEEAEALREEAKEAASMDMAANSPDEASSQPAMKKIQIEVDMVIVDGSYDAKEDSQLKTAFKDNLDSIFFRAGIKCQLLVHALNTGNVSDNTDPCPVVSVRSDLASDDRHAIEAAYSYLDSLIHCGDLNVRGTLATAVRRFDSSSTKAAETSVPHQTNNSASLPSAQVSPEDKKREEALSR